MAQSTTRFKQREEFLNNSKQTVNNHIKSLAKARMKMPMDSVLHPQYTLESLWNENTNSWSEYDSIHFDYDLTQGYQLTYIIYDPMGIPVEKCIANAPNPIAIDTLRTYFTWNPTENKWNYNLQEKLIFDSHGNLEQFIWMDYNIGLSKWDTLWIDLLENSYDLNNRLVEQIYSYTFGNGPLAPYYRDSFYYDQEGMLVQYIQQSYTNSSWINDGKHILSYNSSGLLSEYEKFLFDETSNNYIEAIKYENIDWYNDPHAEDVYFYLSFFSSEKLKSYIIKKWDAVNQNYTTTQQFTRTDLDGLGSHIDSVLEFINNTWQPVTRYTRLVNWFGDEIITIREVYDLTNDAWRVIEESENEIFYANNGKQTEWHNTVLSYDDNGIIRFGRKSIHKDYITLYFNTGVNTSKNVENIQLYPNPTNGIGNLTFTLTNPAEMSIEVRNLLGQKIKTILPNTKADAGKYDFTVELPHTGIYLVQVWINDQVITKKLVRIE